MAIPHPLWRSVVPYWLPLSGRCHVSLTSVTLLLLPLLLRFYSLKPPWSVGTGGKKFVVQDLLRAAIRHHLGDGSSLAQLFSNRWDIGMILVYQGSLDERTSPERCTWSFKDKKAYVLGCAMIQGSNPTFIQLQSFQCLTCFIKFSFNQINQNLLQDWFKKGVLGQEQSVLASYVLASPQQTEKCTVSSLEALKIVFVKAYSMLARMYD